MPKIRLLAGAAIVIALAALLIWLFVRGTESPETTTASGNEPEPSLVSTDEIDDEPEPVAVPTPDTTGRDFERIFNEINDFRNWLYQNPDPKLLGLIYHPDCECADHEHGLLSRMVDEAVHFDAPVFVVESVEQLEDFPTVVRLQVRLDRPDQRLVDAHGEVLEEMEGSGPATLNVALVGNSGRWRIRTLVVTD